MIAVVNKGATPEQLDAFVGWVESKGLSAHISKGQSQTIVGLVGDTSRIDPFLLESMDIIDAVRRVTEPFKKSNRMFHPRDTYIDRAGLRLGAGSFQLIAGPRFAGKRDMDSLASQLKAAGATLLRGGVHVAPTEPYSYGGIDTQALSQLVAAGKAHGMPVVAEAMEVNDVALLLSAGVDIIQVGSRNSQNLALLRELGKTDVPVLLKRGVALTIDELLMSAETIMSGGNEHVILCERGTRGFDPRTPTTLDVSAISALKRLSHLPIFADPSHYAGQATQVVDMALAATAAGADGLFFDVTDDVVSEWSDGAQPLSPHSLEQTVARVMKLREALGKAGS